MLRWLIGIIVGFGFWLIAGTAGAQEPPPLTCPQPLSGQIDSPGDAKQTNRINAGLFNATRCTDANVPQPTPFNGTFGYDKYTFKNRTAGPPDACVTVTLKAAATNTSGLFATVYLDSFDPANIVANYIGSTGNQVGPNATVPFSVKVPTLRDFVVVVNEFVDGGGGAYDLLVEGCGKILISEISPNFGPTAGGTVVTIKGAGFKPESTVTFGGVAGTNVQYVSEFEIRVTTPAYTGGGTSPHAVDVGVTAGPGDPVVKPNGFTYYDKANTVLTLTPSPAIVVYGQGPALIGTITPAKNPNAPTGSITFLEGTRVLGGGQINPANSTGRMVVSGHAVGTYTYTASYAGDPFYNAATSAPATLEVRKSPTTTRLSSSQNPSGPGDPVTYTAIVRGTYATNTTGTVIFNEDGNDIEPAVTLDNGRASVTRTYAGVGTHTITARYSGDGNFLASNGTLSPAQSVTATAPDITITPTPADLTYGTDLGLSVKVATRPTVETPKGRVQLNIDDQNVGAEVALNATGEASFPAQKLLGGTHVIKAVFTSTSANYQSGTATLPFEVKRAPTTAKVESSKPASASGEAVTFTATVTSTVQGGVAFTGTVQFMDGDTKLGSPVAIAAGVAKSEALTTLPNGTRKITAVYSGDTNYDTSTSPSIDQVVGGGGGGGDAGTDGGKTDAGTDSGTVKPDASGVDSGSGGGGGNASTEGGGCDCNTTGTPASGLMALLGGLGFALMLVRRRRA